MNNNYKKMLTIFGILAVLSVAMVGVLEDSDESDAAHYTGIGNKTMVIGDTWSQTFTVPSSGFMWASQESAWVVETVTSPLDSGSDNKFGLSVSSSTGSMYAYWDSSRNCSVMPDITVSAAPTVTGTYTLNVMAWKDPWYVSDYSWSIVFTINNPTSYYTVSYDANGGYTTASTQTVVQGSSLNIYQIPPVKSGVEFSGWKVGSTSTILQPGQSYKPTSNVTLVAQWEEPTPNTNYYITFNTNGGEGGPNTLTASTTASSHTFTIPSNTPTKEGFMFKSWSYGGVTHAYGAGSKNPGDTFTLVEGIPYITLTAQWESVDFVTITYNINGGTGYIDPIVVRKGNTFTLPSSNQISNGNLSLLGWVSPNNSELLEAGSTQTATTNVTYTAVWGSKTTPVASFIYSIDGLKVSFTDTSIAPNVWQWNFGDTVVSTSQSPTHTYSTEGSYTVTLTITNSTEEVSTFSAVVTVGGSSTTTYVVSFDSVGGTPVDSITASGGQKIALLNTTKTDYTFAGWYVEDTLVGNAGSTYIVNGNITLKAKWVSGNVETFSVTFSVDGVIVATQTVVSGGYATFFSVEKDRMAFGGWFEADSDSSFNFGLPIVGDVALLAVFSEESNSIIDYLVWILIIIIVVAIIVASAWLFGIPGILMGILWSVAIVAVALFLWWM